MKSDILQFAVGLHAMDPKVRSHGLLCTPRTVLHDKAGSCHGVPINSVRWPDNNYTWNYFKNGNFHFHNLQFSKTTSYTHKLDTVKGFFVLNANTLTTAKLAVLSTAISYWM